jgi:hypothetical protein
MPPFFPERAFPFEQINIAKAKTDIKMQTRTNGACRGSSLSGFGVSEQGRMTEMPVCGFANERRFAPKNEANQQMQETGSGGEASSGLVESLE